MRRALLSLLLATLLLGAFAAGAVVAIGSRWGAPIVTIDVKNESARALESVSVTFTTCGVRRKLVHTLSEQSSSASHIREVSMRLVVCGEGSQTTTVAFSDGSVVTSGGSYIEPGYTVTYRVTNAGRLAEQMRTFP